MFHYSLSDNSFLASTPADQHNATYHSTGPLIESVCGTQIMLSRCLKNAGGAFYWLLARSVKVLWFSVLLKVDCQAWSSSWWWASPGLLFCSMLVKYLYLLSTHHIYQHHPESVMAVPGAWRGFTSSLESQRKKSIKNLELSPFMIFWSQCLLTPQHMNGLQWRLHKSSPLRNFLGLVGAAVCRPLQRQREAASCLIVNIS